MPGKRRVRMDSLARISSKALLGNLVRRFSRSSQPPTSSESLIVNGLDLDMVNLHISSYLSVTYKEDKLTELQPHRDRAHEPFLSLLMTCFFKPSSRMRSLPLGAFPVGGEAVRGRPPRSRPRSPRGSPRRRRPRP